LIGTTNSSTLLAKRTRDIIRSEKPDCIYVQTNEKWWSVVKDLKNIDSQEELNEYNPMLRDTQEWHMENNPRSVIFKLRFYPWLFLLMQMFSTFCFYFPLKIFKDFPTPSILSPQASK
jgi:hypothetical protein